MIKATDKVICFNKHDGAVEACWAHNPEVGRSKLPRAKINQFIKQKQLCLKNWLIIGNSELRLGKNSKQRERMMRIEKVDWDI